MLIAIQGPKAQKDKKDEENWTDDPYLSSLTNQHVGQCIKMRLNTERLDNTERRKKRLNY